MKRTLFALMMAALLLVACAPKAATTPAYYEQPMAAPMLGGAPEMEMRAPADEPAPTAVYDSSQNYAAGQPPAQDRLVIQNADLSIVVKDPKATMDAIAHMAQQMGGFVVSSNLYQTYTPVGETVPEASITIRVPALKLEDALTQVKAEVVEVQSETRSGQDVTKEYVDLKSRLKNLEAAEQQLTDIMDRATKIEDVLNVFNQLTYYREQIEVVKGQMQYYEEASALSAISVRIVAEETVKPIEIGGWKPVGVARDAVQALINFLQGFTNFLIWLIIFILPMLIFIALPFWLIWLGIRALIRRRKAKKTPPAS